MMKKTYIIVIVLVIMLVVGFCVVRSNSPRGIIDTGGLIDEGYKNATYMIDGRSFTLKNGLSEVETTPGSATKTITRYFGNEVKHDLNDDGREDVVFLLTQSSGGSGTFYYVVAALNTPSGYLGSEALFIGDRIAPQTTEIDEGETAKGTKRQNVIVVNFADRLPGESFATSPSVGKSIWLKLDPTTMKFGEVAQDFEGESE